MEELDPIAAQLLQDAQDSGLMEAGAAEYDEAYGIGTWPKATLTDVITAAGNDYGFRLTLKLNLKGEEGMAFTGRFDLPRTLASNGHEVEAWQTKRETDKLAVLNRGLAALGYTSVVKKNIDDEATYEAVAGLFRAKIGSACPVKVKADGKNKKDDAGKWTFEANGFTRLDFLKPRK